MSVEWLHPSIVEAGKLVSSLVLLLALAQSTFYFVQVALAFFELRRAHELQRRLSAPWLLGTTAVPGISLLVPAFNEERSAVESIHSLLTLRYPRFEIIVVNDGSQDRTLERIVSAFQLAPAEVATQSTVPHQAVRGVYRARAYPNLLVIDKANGGKSDSLNAALSFARHPLVCAVDADSLLDHNALLLAARPFIDEPDAMIAVGGTIRIANGSTVRGGTVVEERAPRHLLPLFQVIEYFRAFLLARLASSRLGAVTIISGAFGLFKRSAVVEVGGYSTRTVGEDMELIVRLHRRFRESGRRYSIRFLPDPVCWTEVPETIGDLRRQRVRWQRGMCETLWMHRRMIFNPGYGSVGLFSLPQFLLFDVVGAILDLAGLVFIPTFFALGILSFDFLLAYFSVVALTGIFLSMMSFVIAEHAFFKTTRRRDLIAFALAAIGENFGYRHLNSFWRIEGIWQFLLGRQGWGRMTRRGFEDAAPTPSTVQDRQPLAADNAWRFREHVGRS